MRISHGARPGAYWDRRHRRLGQCLDGVGQIGLGQASNERDYAVKWQRIAAVLDRLAVTPQWSVIDAGCGVGWFTEKLIARGHVTRGVDFSKEAIALARQRVGDAASFEVSPLDRWTPRHVADLVICIDVMFHIVDDRRWRDSLKALTKAVGRDGLMLIQEHLGDGSHGAPSAAHVRWRSLSDYKLVLSDWEMVYSERYVLPESGSYKDIMVWKKQPKP